MGLTLAALKADRRKISFDFILEQDEEAQTEKFEVVTLTYKPSVMTPSFEKELNTIIRDPNGHKSEWLAPFISQMVVSWDVEGDTPGEPYPITEESLRELPSIFLAEISIQITDDMGKARRTSKSG